MAKEAYFQAESIEDRAAAMRAAIATRSDKGIQRFSPPDCALLVLDLQRYFLEPASHAYIPSAPAILPAINRLVEAFSKHELPVLFTQHINKPENAKMMAAWWGDLIREDSPLSAIPAEIGRGKHKILQKSQYDAFYETELLTWLREKKVKQVVICGVMTHLCCESTARSAFVQGFEVFFPVDGTATYKQDFHLATLRNLAHGFANIVLMKELIQALEDQDAG